MDPTQQEILDIFTRTRALMKGHFVLRSGLHSGHYFQCAQVCQHMDAVERLGELLFAEVSEILPLCQQVDDLLIAEQLLGPRKGLVGDLLRGRELGDEVVHQRLVLGQEVARRAKARYIFCEKEDNVLVMRRGFTLAPGEAVLVVEDVVTRGGRVNECLEIVRRAGGAVAGVAMLVDRSAGTVRFDAPFVSLLELSFPTYPADNVPEALAKLPIEKPGS